MAKILCIDDDQVMRTVLARVVRDAGHEFVGAAGAAEALKALRDEQIDLAVCDFQMPGIDGIELIKLIRAERDRTPVIMLTGFGSIDHAMEAIRAGATDYLVKPFDPEHLTHRIDESLSRRRLERELDELRGELAAQRHNRRLIGRSPTLDRALELVAAAARSRATVLLEGESGTGKELLAREIHEASDRRRGPFIKLNCAALPEGLVESALFGHEKGAFTGALRRVEGAFERADGGTLLLDEISEMRLDLQAKLLRVLQEREFERVGGSQPISVDVRVIATTNRELRAEAEAGHFRRDLYYRLNVIRIVAPPLRDRRSDIPLLAHHFASRFAAEAKKEITAISPAAVAILQQYSWPGNVRELQHAVERAVVLSAGPVLDAAAFDGVQRALAASAEAGDLRAAGPASAAISLPTLNLDEAEAAIIREALRQTKNNRTHAAALLGIGVRTLRKKLNAPPRSAQSAEQSAEQATEHAAEQPPDEAGE